MSVSRSALQQIDGQERVNHLEREVALLRQKIRALERENRRLKETHTVTIGLPFSLLFIEYLANHLPQCIVQAFDQNLRYFFTGGEGLELIGVSPEHFIGKTLQEVEIADSDTPSFFEPIYRAALNGQYREYTFHTQKKHIYEGVVLPLIDSDGEVVAGLVICKENVTKQQAEQVLTESAVVEERQRIAQELHDVVSQTLFTVNMIADVLPKLWERSPETAQKKLKLMRHNTQLAFIQMRTLLYELRPQSLTEVILPELLKQLVTTMTARTEMTIELSVNCQDDWFELPHTVKIALYRIAQEGMNNAIQHARAKVLFIRIECDPLTQQVSLRLQDDGQGFDPSGNFPGHLGLKIMRDRAAQTDIGITIKSKIGCGTEICATWTRAHTPSNFHAKDSNSRLR